MNGGIHSGAHILSGNVFDPRALDELIPTWREEGAPLMTEAKHDRAYVLTKNRAWRVSVPPPMRNKGNYIISLRYWGILTVLRNSTNVGCFRW